LGFLLCNLVNGFQLFLGILLTLNIAMPDMIDMLDFHRLQKTPELMSIVNSLTVEAIQDMSPEEINAVFKRILEVI